jgi:hypothetical protein
MRIHFNVSRWKTKYATELITDYNPPAYTVGMAQEMGSRVDIPHFQRGANFGRTHANVIDILSRNLLDFEPEFWSVALELFEAAFSVLAEVVVVTDYKFPRSDRIDKDPGNKFQR